MMLTLKQYEIWFVTGSQHLYGPETLQQVEAHAKQMVEGMDLDPAIPYKLLYKPVVTTPEAIASICTEANSAPQCAGIITWMHTFSPAKMWIAGLTLLNKPLLHLHTQYNRDIPWEDIDMDFMNLNQAAHGDREFGFIGARLDISRKVIVGYWEDGGIRKRIANWMHTAVGLVEGSQLKVARFGDNMRQVAVTEGDKVEAQIKLGWTINGYGVGDLVDVMQSFSDADVDQLFEQYAERYTISAEGLKDGPIKNAIREQARIELGLKAFLVDGGYSAFTTTFEDLHGLKQLPGLAAQRLMEAGYGFAGEGDWKTAALGRMMKIMAGNKGTSFMEDYTYHMAPGNGLVLGSHMLEICPTIAADQVKIEVHPLGIGGKADPARMVFNGGAGQAINASLIDLGHRFRLLINQVEAIDPIADMPKLPVARVLWKPEPSLEQSAEAWIYAGGAHHTVFSYEVSVEQLIDWADMVNIETVIIDKDTKIHQFRQQLQWSSTYWQGK